MSFKLLSGKKEDRLTEYDVSVGGMNLRVSSNLAVDEMGHLLDELLLPYAFELNTPEIRQRIVIDLTSRFHFVELL